MPEPMTWTTLRPLFESMFFDLGPKEIHRQTGLGCGTLYDLLHGKSEPVPRTLRDLQRAIGEWQPGVYGTERSSR
jgi:hypothetical protein